MAQTAQQRDTGNENGYIKKNVNGKEYSLSHRHQGTDADSLARRLLVKENVDNVFVQHSGEISVSLSNSDRFVVGDHPNTVMETPDGYEVDWFGVGSYGGEPSINMKLEPVE